MQLPKSAQRDFSGLVGRPPDLPEESAPAPVAAPEPIASDLYKTAGTSPPTFHNIVTLNLRRLRDGSTLNGRKPFRLNVRKLRKHLETLYFHPELKDHLAFIHRVQRQATRNRRYHYQFVRGIRTPPHPAPCWTGDSCTRVDNIPHVVDHLGDIHVGINESLPSRVLTDAEKQVLIELGGWMPSLLKDTRGFHVFSPHIASTGVYSGHFSSRSRRTHRGSAISKPEARKYALVIHNMRVPQNVKNALVENILDGRKSADVARKYNVSVEILYTYKSRVLLRVKPQRRATLPTLSQTKDEISKMCLSWGMESALLRVTYYQMPISTAALAYHQDPLVLSGHVNILWQCLQRFIPNPFNDLQELTSENCTDFVPFAEEGKVSSTLNGCARPNEPPNS